MIYTLFLKHYDRCDIQEMAIYQFLSPVRRQAIIWTNADSMHWRIFVADGGMS